MRTKKVLNYRYFLFIFFTCSYKYQRYNYYKFKKIIHFKFLAEFKKISNYYAIDFNIDLSIYVWGSDFSLISNIV